MSSKNWGPPFAIFCSNSGVSSLLSCVGTITRCIMSCGQVREFYSWWFFSPRCYCNRPELMLLNGFSFWNQLGRGHVHVHYGWWWADGHCRYMLVTCDEGSDYIKVSLIWLASWKILFFLSCLEFSASAWVWWGLWFWGIENGVHARWLTAHCD